MIYKEINQDLFSMPDEYWKVQCISADLVMGKGIAVKFNEFYDMKNIMKKCYGKEIPWQGHGMCRFVLGTPVFNLITKPYYYFKPSLKTMEEALREMKWYCSYYHVDKLSMPQIGCGLDRLNWEEVSELIQKVFSDTEVEIVVCKMTTYKYENCSAI